MGYEDPEKRRARQRGKAFKDQRANTPAARRATAERGVALEAAMSDSNGPGCLHGPGYPKATKPGMAWCNGCDPPRWRKLEEFRCNNAVKVGIRAQCRECVSTYEREHRREEKERLVIRGMMLAVAAIEEAIKQRAGRSVPVPTRTALLKSRADSACL